MKRFKTNSPQFRGTAWNGTLTGVEWQRYRKERTAMNFETIKNKYRLKLFYFLKPFRSKFVI